MYAKKKQARGARELLLGGACCSGCKPGTLLINTLPACSSAPKGTLCFMAGCWRQEPASGRPEGLLKIQQEHLLALLRAFTHFVTLSAREALSGFNFVQLEATSCL